MHGPGPGFTKILQLILVLKLKNLSNFWIKYFRETWAWSKLMHYIIWFREDIFSKYEKLKYHWQNFSLLCPQICSFLICFCFQNCKRMYVSNVKLHPTNSSDIQYWHSTRTFRVFLSKKIMKENPYNSYIFYKYEALVLGMNEWCFTARRQLWSFGGKHMAKSQAVLGKKRKWLNEKL